MERLFTSPQLTFKSIGYFVLPSVVMMVIHSIYATVDAIFVSRVIGPHALAALNIVMPFWGIFGAISIMLGSGGCAIIAKHMGEGRYYRAGSSLAFLYAFAFICAIAMVIVIQCFIPEICHFLGATPVLKPYAESYLRALSIFIPSFTLQTFASFFLVAAGRQSLAMKATLIGGLLNILFDYLLMIHWAFGITGAGIATGISASIPGICATFFFFRNRGPRKLFFIRPRWSGRLLWNSSVNGSSEMISSLAYSVTTFLFNYMTLRYMGEMGVAAIAALLYMEFFFASAFFGFAQGASPVISFIYGAQDIPRLKQMLKICLAMVSLASLIVFAVVFCFPGFFISCFTPQGSEIFILAEKGLRYFSFAYLVMGLNIFTSAFFTALSNGVVSAGISFLRTLVLISTAIMVLPYFLGSTGIWLALPVAEMLALIIAGIAIVIYRRRYQYL